jgi:hypothetical protein
MICGARTGVESGTKPIGVGRRKILILNGIWRRSGGSGVVGSQFLAKTNPAQTNFSPDLGIETNDFGMFWIGGLRKLGLSRIHCRRVSRQGAKSQSNKSERECCADHRGFEIGYAD